MLCVMGFSGAPGHSRRRPDAHVGRVLWAELRRRLRDAWAPPSLPGWCRHPLPPLHPRSRRRRRGGYRGGARGARRHGSGAISGLSARASTPDRRAQAIPGARARVPGGGGVGGGHCRHGQRGRERAARYAASRRGSKRDQDSLRGGGVKNSYCPRRHGRLGVRRHAVGHAGRRRDQGSWWRRSARHVSQAALVSPDTRCRPEPAADRQP